MPSGRCAPEWLPTHRGRIAGCPCVPFWAPLSGPAASALPPSSSGNPLTYLNYLSSSVSAKKWGRFIIGSVKYLPWFISLPLEPLKKLHFCATFVTDDSEAQLSRRMPTRVIFQRPRKERELRREGCLFWAIALSPSGWLYCQLERDALARCLGRQISPAASLRTRPSNGDPITCPLILFQSFCTSIKWDVRRSSLLSPPSPGRAPEPPHIQD